MSLSCLQPTLLSYQLDAALSVWISVCKLRLGSVQLCQVFSWLKCHSAGLTEYQVSLTLQGHLEFVKIVWNVKYTMKWGYLSDDDFTETKERPTEIAGCFSHNSVAQRWKLLDGSPSQRKELLRMKVSWPWSYLNFLSYIDISFSGGGAVIGGVNGVENLKKGRLGKRKKTP